MNKNKIEKAPYWVINLLKSIRSKVQIVQYTILGSLQILKISMSKRHMIERLGGIISQEVHRIEKGLSHIEFREGFGTLSIKRLINALETLYDLQKKVKEKIDGKYYLGIQALKAYNEKHKEPNNNTVIISNFLLRHSLKDEEFRDYQCGVQIINAKEIKASCNREFDVLSRSRHSIRYFSEADVNINDIEKAIHIAMYSPSACNRQAWKVRIIQNDDIIRQFNKVHKGFSNKDQCLKTLLLITSMNTYYDYPLEINQRFIDPSLFSMSLVYALTHLGYATCILNANLSTEGKKIIKNMLDIDYSEDLVLFIAVGHYQTNNTIPISMRDDYKEKVVYYLNKAKPLHF